MTKCDCIFCKIVNNEIGSMKIYESDDVIAFLDIFPASEGHTVVIPKQHIDNLSNCNPQLLASVIIAVQEVAKILANKLGVKDFNYLSNQGKKAGQEIDHFHFHVIPKYEKDKGWSATTLSKPKEDVELIFKKIKD